MKGKKNYDRNYYNVHKWIIREYGRAEECLNPKCDKISGIYEWALRKGMGYEKNIENFIPLCKRCHRHYDDSEQWKLNIKRGIQLS